MAERLAVEREDAFWAGVDHAGMFFMGEADVVVAGDFQVTER